MEKNMRLALLGIFAVVVCVAVCGYGSGEETTLDGMRSAAHSAAVIRVLRLAWFEVMGAFQGRALKAGPDSVFRYPRVTETRRNQMHSPSMPRRTKISSAASKMRVLVSVAVCADGFTAW